MNKMLIKAAMMSIGYKSDPDSVYVVGHIFDTDPPGFQNEKTCDTVEEALTEMLEIIKSGKALSFIAMTRRAR